MQATDYDDSAYKARVRCAHILVRNATDGKLNPSWFALMYKLLAVPVIPTRALHFLHSSALARSDVMSVIYNNMARGSMADDAYVVRHLDWIFLALENS